MSTESGILQIRLFGKLSLDANGTSATRVRSERLQALLAFLLLHRDAPQTRQHVAFQLWSEVGDTEAKANLRRRLHELKQRLPYSDRHLKTEHTTVQWIQSEGCWLDIAAFESAIDQAQINHEQSCGLLKQAADLYQGDLLPSCYDEWIEPYRDRFRQQAITALDALIPQLAEQHQVRAAIGYAQQLQRIDPLYEPAYCHLMRLHAQEGDRASALQVYHQCMTLLQDELGVPPSPSTYSLYEEILTLENNPRSFSSKAKVKSPAPDSPNIKSAASDYEISDSEVSISASSDSLEQEAVPEPDTTLNGKAGDTSISSLEAESGLISKLTTPLPTHVATDSATVSRSAPHIDWGEAPDLRFFHGRSEEINQLKDWINQNDSRLIALLGMGGIGKTTLAAKVAREMEEEFDYLIWRSLRNAPPLETLLNDLILFLSNQQDTVCSVTRLIHWLRHSRCLVILDNFETILKEGERAGHFREGYENYSELIQVVGQASHQSCLVITSREKPAEISTFEGINLAVRSIQIAGSPEAALALLKARDLVGSQEQKEQLGERYGYSPLALQIVGGSIRDVFSGDISLFLEEDTLLFNGAKKLLDLQFARLIPLEKTVMYWLAINREWTSITELMADIYPKCSKRELLEALESLCWRSLIERRGNTYTQQPVVMEYVTVCLIEAVSDELFNPSSFDEDSENDSSEQPYLSTYALVKTTVKDFVRESQCRLIVQPILENLQDQLQVPTTAADHIRELLTNIRKSEVHRLGYVGGNLLNLCCQGHLDITGFDFSNLAIRQAYLQGATLHHLNLIQADFIQSVFTQAFGSALSIVFSPDGMLLAMGDNNYNIQLWHASDGRPLMTLEGHKGWIWSIAFSPDGKTLVSGSVDYTVRLWDVFSGQCLRTLQGHGSVVWAVAFGPDGQTVASGSEDQTAKLWDVKTGECLQTLDSQAGLVRAVLFSPDGNNLVTGHADSTVRWWTINTGECLRIFQGHQAPVWSIALHPKGQMLASAGADQSVRLWDINTGDCLSTLAAHTDQIWAIAFSPDGQMLASGSHDQTVRLWDIQTEQCLATLVGHTDQIWSIGFSPDGQMLASGGFDQTIRLWDIETHQCIQILHGYTNCIRSLTFCSERCTLISGGDDSLIRLWDIDTGQCLQTLKGHRSGVWAIACHQQKDTPSSDSRPILATGGFDQVIRIWDMATGRCTQTLDGRAGWVHGLAFHPDGKRLASGSIQPMVRLWDLTAGQCYQQLQGHTNQVWSVAFSPDGRYLASTGADHMIKLWDVESGECLHTLQEHSDWMYALAFSPPQSPGAVTDLPESWLASASGDRTIKLWDVDTGKCFQTLTGHAGWVYALAIHPAGHLLTSASHDHTARIWDLQTGECLHVLTHEAPLWSIALHPQGHLLACSGEDEKITLWDVESGERQNSLPILKPYAGMRITDVTGLTEAQKSALKALGAIEYSTNTKHFPRAERDQASDAWWPI